ncbi:MAG: peptidase M15 [Ignavibacteriae bacterium]|nr:peptidase M15 [Ignavibacteriota bacterium]
MKRRDFLKYASSSLILPTIPSLLEANVSIKNSIFGLNDTEYKFKSQIDIYDEKIDTKNVFLDSTYLLEFKSVREKLNSIQNHVGYGNFNIISFDEMLNIARYSKNIKKFTKKEIEFLESIFYYNPTSHGFYGEKISQNITDVINKKEVLKIPGTGHYLFKGEPLDIYNRLTDDIGNSLVLTSGIRSIVKQSKLFLDKIHSVDGNLSLASKSLAPPAYTYHSIADFDVGKKGFGYANFTSRFALTQEFLKMRKLAYVDMRYTLNNKDGVRYEPWHVKVI